MQATDDDFTAGPARFVVASDGVQDCAALLMPIPLTVDIREAIEEQRAYAQKVQVAGQQQIALMQLEGKVKLEIANHEYRIAQASETEASGKATSALQGKLDSLRLMLADVKSRKEAIEQQLLTDAMVLRNCQQSVNNTLEEAFLAAALIDPPDDQPVPQSQELDLQAEYLAFQQRQQEPDEEPQDIEPLEMTGDEIFEPTNDHLSSDDLAEIDLMNDFYAAQENLVHAQNRFDRREIDREKDRQTTDQSPEAFDIHWVHRFREVTSQLIAAEAAFTAAKVAANEAGVDIGGEDQCSMFADRDDDGYRESHDAACTASAPRDKILQWVEGISDEADPGELCGDIEVDEWDAQEMDLSDSVSCVAVGSYRSKIDQWNS